MVSPALVFPQIDRAVPIGTTDTEIVRLDEQIGYRMVIAHINRADLAFTISGGRAWAAKQILTLPAGTKVLRTFRLQINALDFTHPLNATPIELGDDGDIALGTVGTTDDNLTSVAQNQDLIDAGSGVWDDFTAVDTFDKTKALANPVISTSTGIFLNVTIDPGQAANGDVLIISGSLLVGYDYLGS